MRERRDSSRLSAPVRRPDARRRSLISYAFRKSDEDTRNAVYQELSAQSRNLLVDLDKASAFSTPELLAVSDERFETSSVRRRAWSITVWP